MEIVYMNREAVDEGLSDELFIRIKRRLFY
jgi:hypothetical protein